MPWRVTRTDDNGVEHVMARGLTEDEARTLVERMTARGHKQTYTMERQDPRGST
jgi:Fe-S cluster assembly scaffold protein SufB